MQSQNKKAISRFSKKIRDTQRIIISNEDTIIPYSVKQDNRGTVGKPHGGLWYSCGNSWLEWCLSEDFGFGMNVHELELDMDNIKLISNVREFDDFTGEFGIPYEKRFSEMLAMLSGNRFRLPYDLPERHDYIDWARLEDLGFMGIEINPYLWQRRLNYGMWYYGWDCASGCIWNSEAVKNVFPIVRFDKGKIVRVK